MKGMEDFISRIPTTAWLTNFRNMEPAVRIQGRRCIPPPTVRALLGTPTGGHYTDPGYQHKGHHRLSPHEKSSVRIDPGIEVRNEKQPEEKTCFSGTESNEKTHFSGTESNKKTRFSGIESNG